MRLKDIIEEKKDGLLSEWFDEVVGDYSLDAAGFIKGRGDRFANPVGYNLRAALGGILDCIVTGAGADALAPHVDGIVRVRAVQDFSPSGAVGFVFTLKKILRRKLSAAMDGMPGGDPSIRDELARLEDELDLITLQVFEAYVMCREKLYEIRGEEVKRNAFRLLERARLITGETGGPPGAKTDGPPGAKTGEPTGAKDGPPGAKDRPPLNETDSAMKTNEAEE